MKAKMIVLIGVMICLQWVQVWASKEVKFYIYPLGQEFWWRWPNCTSDSPFTNYAQNSGIGPVLDEARGLFDTYQFSMFSSMYQRLKRSGRRTRDPEQADVFVIPFDYSLAKRADYDCRARGQNYCPPVMYDMAKKVLFSSPYYRRHKGIDHLVISSLTGPIYDACGEFFKHCSLCAVTNYWLSPQPEESNFVSVPWPSYYHWQQGQDGTVESFARKLNRPWDLEHVKSRKHFVSYAGGIKVMNSEHSKIRRHIVEECRKSARCNYVDVKRVMEQKTDVEGAVKESTTQSGVITSIMAAYAQSIFCLCPPGDDPSRRALIDMLLSGCIPVMFTPVSFHNGQYPWHIGEETAARISVLIPAAVFLRRLDNVHAGMVPYLESIPPADVAQRQKLIAELAPTLQYSMPPTQLLTDIADETPWDPPFRDAVDITIDGVFDRAQRYKALDHGDYTLFADNNPKRVPKNSPKREYYEANPEISSKLIPGLRYMSWGNWVKTFNHTIP